MGVAQLIRIYKGRVRGIRVRSQQHGREIEVEIAGHVETLGPVAARSLIRKLEAALAYAEGYPEAPKAHIAASARAD